VFVGIRKGTDGSCKVACEAGGAGEWKCRVPCKSMCLHEFGKAQMAASVRRAEQAEQVRGSAECLVKVFVCRI
jgi:hypothetical protein